jgi:hypothetical protein
MKIFIDDKIAGDPDVSYKFMIEDSYSKELESLTKNIDARTWIINKQTIVIITIDENNREITDLIIQMARKIIESIKGIDYLEDMITTVKYMDLNRIKS